MKRRKILDQATNAGIIFLWLALCFSPLSSRGDQLYVSPNGSDANDGSSTKPFKTIDYAKERAGELRTSEKFTEPIEIILLAGEYPIVRPLYFGPEDSGTEKCPLIIRGQGEVTISGGIELGAFVEITPSLWKIDVSEYARYGFRPNQFYVNGIRADCARTPNKDEFFKTKAVTEFLIDTASLVRPGLAVQKLHLDELQMDVLDHLPTTSPGDLWVEIYHNWTTTKKPVQSKSNDALYITSRPSPPWNKLDDNSQFVFVNHRSLLDAPGEWFYSKEEQAVYYVPRPGDNLESSVATVPILDQLLIVRGKEDALVSDIHIENIAFKYTKYELPGLGKEGQQAESSSDAAVMLDYANRIRFANCEITHTGKYGLWFRDACTDSEIVQSYIHDLGAGGIKIGTLKIPDDEQWLTQDILIDNNIIRSGGHELPAGVGIIVFNASDNTISHNEIADFRYSGISMGWVWGYKHSPTKRNKIIYNHIHHLGWGQLSDMGGIYLLGASEGTIVSHNVIHHIYAYGYGGWGIYTDEGSKGILVENNLVYRCKSGGFHQHYGRENRIVNNIFANQLKAQLEASRVEEHTSFTFKRNVIYFEQGELYGINWDKVRFQADSNIYWTTHLDTLLFGKMTFNEWRHATGKDLHSIITDPDFENPSGNDYRFKNSKAISKINFKPFPYDRAGVYGHSNWVDLARFDNSLAEKFNRMVITQMALLID